MIMLQISIKYYFLSINFNRAQLDLLSKIKKFLYSYKGMVYDIKC